MPRFVTGNHQEGVPHGISFDEPRFYAAGAVGVDVSGDGVEHAAVSGRAGRAGRTAPGRVIRLYTAEDFARRPAREAPEITRRELSQTVLDLLAMGIRDARELPWLEAPPE